MLTFINLYLKILHLLNLLKMQILHLQKISLLLRILLHIYFMVLHLHIQLLPLLLLPNKMNIHIYMIMVMIINFMIISMNQENIIHLYVLHNTKHKP